MTDAPAPDDLLDVQQIADLLDIGAQYVRDLLLTGTLPGEKLVLRSGRIGWVARRRDVEAYRAARPHRRPRLSTARPGTRPDDPMFQEFSELNAQIAAAKQVLDGLEDRRKQRIAAWSDQGRSDGQIGDAVGLAKQRVNTIRHVEQSKRAAPAEERALYNPRKFEPEPEPPDPNS